jgi:hypothetical protein
MIENLTREQSIPRFGKTLSLSRRAASGTLTPGGAGDKLASRGHRRQADRRGEGSAQDLAQTRELEPELSFGDGLH